MASQPKNARVEEEEKAPHGQKIEQVNQLQIEIDRLNEKASAEILEVEQRFNKLRKPLFDQRSKIIAQIPHFWMRVMENHSPLRSIINSKDLEVLEYLKNLEVQEFDDIKSGYRITLTFEPNPFFTNTTVEKEFHIGDNGKPFVKATEINWNPGKNVVEQVQDDSAAGRKHAHDTGSFFNWFAEEEDLANDDIGDMIKDELWVSPVPYFLALYEEEEEDDLSDEYDEEVEGEDDEVIDEEFDEEDEEGDEDKSAEVAEDGDSKDQ